MSKTREVRELQFSSTQLIVLFMAILILGVFIFLLGVSVGKKQVKLTQEANLIKNPQYEPVHRVKPTVPKETEPSAIDKEIASHAKQAGTATQTPDQSLPVKGEPGMKPGAKTTPAQEKAAAKTTPTMTPPATQTKTESATKLPAAKAPTTAQKQPALKQTAPAKQTTLPAAKPAAPIKGLYYVQLAAFDERKGAEDYAAEIKAAGFPTIILNPLATDKKPWYRVRIGGYTTKDDAEQAVLRLKSIVNKKKFEYWITRD